MIVLVPFVKMLVGTPLIISGHGMQVHTFSLLLKLRGLFAPFPNANLLRDCSRWLLRNGLEDLNQQLLKLLSFTLMAPHTWSRFFFRILALRSSRMEHGLLSRLLALILLKSLEWRKDLSEGDDLDSVQDFLAERASSNATSRVGTKAKGKGTGKAKHDKSATCRIKFQDSLSSHVNTCISRMLGDHTGHQVDGWKTSGHNLRDDFVRAVVQFASPRLMHRIGLVEGLLVEPYLPETFPVFLKRGISGRFGLHLAAC